ncbi:MAG: Carboxypeptidase regulatory-like domain [Acidimicrobiaceae bacterium]
MSALDAIRTRLRSRGVRRLQIGVPIVVPLAVLSVFVVRGCATATVPLVHPPPGVTLPAKTATTAPSDLTGVALVAVDGKTTTVPSRNSGTAHLSGSVNGPQGPVPGATVVVEHLVDDKPPPINVGTNPEGRWDLPNIAGGRYRVRAFLAPSLAQVQPEVFFLNDGDQRSLDLTVENFVGASVVAAVAPDPPHLNQPLNLVVRVARKVVDSTGVVRSQPTVNAGVALTGTPGWTVKGSPSGFTNGTGDVTFALECKSVGANQVQVVVRATPSDPPQPASLEVSACTDPGATSTTSTSAPASSGPPTTTTSSSSQN